ncbi:MAG TPA: dephospho-CoA kinase [Caulobacteraceae bacterium]|nr:dephospho-CoA kinase [Caulobacteraceae bacterium]
MIVVGLTGSIGMGKTTIGKLFEAAGVPVYDADAEVHKLYAKGGAAAPLVEEAFPGVMVDGAIDRAALSKKVVGDERAMKALEEIVHPLVGETRAGFFEKARKAGADVVILDIPLLFETGGEKRVDKVVVVSASPDVQRERVLEREGMTAEKFDAILARQTPDTQKRARADYVIDTGGDFEDTKAQVRQVIAALRGLAAQAGA